VDQTLDAGWWSANMLDAACRFCVPVFLMISGALLLGYQQPDGPFIQKRLKRIMIPLVLWSLVYVLHDIWKAPHSAFSGSTLISYLKDSYRHLRDGVSYHLWYVYMLPGLYLFLPILNAWIKQAPIRQIRIFLILWGISVLFTMPWFASILPHFDLYYFAGYGSFMVAGFFLYRFRNTMLHRHRWLPWLLYGVAVAGVGIGTGIVNEGAQSFNELFYMYRSPLVALMSIAVFCAGLQFSGKRLPNWIARIDETSYGIYLVHVLVLEYVWWMISILTASGVLRIVLASVVTFVLSYMIIAALRAIRPIRNWVG
jgi:surface polysaccharide O-acyltransferase-like enzyme